ncbi:Nup62, partial [Symbiodinium sp. CCMP2456]
SSGGSLFGSGPASGGAAGGASLFGAGSSGGASTFGGGSGSAGLFGSAASGGATGFSSGGTAGGLGFGAAGAAAGAGGELQQARATVIEHRKVSDLLRMWEERIQKQAQHFDAFAEQILRFDTDVIANAAKVKVLREEHAQLKARQELADRSIQQIWEQQDSLGRLLASLTEALRTQPQQADEAAGSAAAPVRAHQRSLGLTMQLDELERQAEDLARETGKVQSNLYKEPLTTVVRVLDAHASALDAIQNQVGSVTQRIHAIEGAL